MEFVQESTKAEITDWNQWVDKYIYRHSDLYKQFKSMAIHISYSSNNGEMHVDSPYHLWISMLKSPNVIIESVETNTCCGLSGKKDRYNVILNDRVIAVIDKFKGGKTTEYKYASIPTKCMGDIISEYISQLT